MIKKFESLEKLNEHTADLFVRIANKAISEKGRFTVALTGGSSPKGLYHLLSETEYSKKIDWTKVFVFWGDERWVPLHSPLSNSGAAIRNFLDKTPVLKERVFPMYQKNVTPEEYAKIYASILEEHLDDSKHFDLILLGMGDDGHTASLFPGEAVLEEKEEKVKAYFLKSQEMHRITLTAPLINDANNIIFLVFGENKKDALFQVLEGTETYHKYPSKLINPKSGNIYWMVDQKAASKLDIP